MRKAIMSIIAVLVLNTSAYAQWAVIDPANLAQNIMNVASTVQQESINTEQLMAQLQQVENELLQLKSLAQGDVSGLLGTVQTALTNQKAYSQSVRGLYGDLNSAKTVAVDLYSRMGASGLSQEDWMKREAERNAALKQGDGFFTDYQVHILDQVLKRYEELRNLQAKITTTAGTHEAMQLMNSQMNVLVTTTNQLLEYNAAIAQRQTEREVELTGRRKAVNDSYSGWLNGVRAARQDAYKMLENVSKTAN